MRKYILVTGGTGFIGSNLVEKLLINKIDVLVLKRSFSNLNNISNFQNKYCNLKLINLDEINISDIFQTYNIEGVIHLAANSQRVQDFNGISQMVNSNIKFPSELLECMVNSSARYFINTGSFFEYSFDYSPINENSLLKPYNFYGATKIAFENILKYYNENFDINACTLKLFSPYGPKDNEKKVIPYLIINSLKNNKLVIKSSTKELDFVYIADIIEAYCKAIKNINKFEGYQSFNIGTGIPTSIKDVHLLIEDILNSKVENEYHELEKDKVWCSNKKAFDYLNWKPLINLFDGLTLTIEYYKKILGIN